jgi:2-polyprenyl-3-methyl-5-hydroxy-6-metoxy-1,4-benzoquinol methylase
MSFRQELAEVKSRIAESDMWYPYGALDNFTHLDRLLPAGYRNLAKLAGGRAIADIGAADGDMAFFLAQCGFEIDILDWGPTNFNHLKGARLLAEYYASPVDIHEIDLDTQFTLPRVRYGLILFLGILYHLQNPFFALNQLSRHTEYLVLSTRIAAVTPDGKINFQALPMAYLVAPEELNSDPTNYWILSLEGLRRLAIRTGWEIVAEMTAGCIDGTSDPASPDHDERAFMLLRSQQIAKDTLSF